MMEDIAEQIVRTARMMPSKTAVVLTCNDVSIAKVAVTGGVGFEVRARDACLLFPFKEVRPAAECFVTTAHEYREDRRVCPPPLVVHHMNGIPMLSVEWNCADRRHEAIRSITRILERPPLCDKPATVEGSTVPFDATGLPDWDTK